MLRKQLTEDNHAARTCCAVRLCFSLIAFLVLHMCILVVSRYDDLMVCLLCYYREDRGGKARKEVVAVIQWILTEHYQEWSVSEELLKEMLFWSCWYVHTLLIHVCTNGMYMYIHLPLLQCVCIHLY